MTSNRSPADPLPSEPSRAPSGLANVFRNLGLRNRSGHSIPSVPVTPNSSEANRSSPHLEDFGDVSSNGVYALVEKLRKDRSLSDRVEAARALKDIVADFPAPLISHIWYNAQDLVDVRYPAEARQSALKLFAACLKTLSEPSALERLRYYQTITQHDHPDDFDDQLHAMIVLTSGGRNLASFERKIGGLLSKWLQTLFAEAGKVRQLRKREGSPPDGLSGAELCLQELFRFVTAIIKFNFQTFEEREVHRLLSDVLSICRRTTSKKDIEGAVVFIETLVTYGYIPPVSLRPCVEVLCGSYATIRDFADATWKAVSNLCRSHMAHSCIFTLLDILRGAQRKSLHPPNTNTLRGAVLFLEKILMENGRDGLPRLQVSALMPALRDALGAESVRVELEVVKAISHILNRPEVLSQFSVDEWSIPLEILVHASRRTTERADGTSLKRLGVKDVPKPRSQDRDINTAISQTIFEIVNLLEGFCRNPGFPLVDEVVGFFLDVFGHIPDSAAELVITHHASEHSLYPSCSKWLENSKKLIDVFLNTRTRPAEIRILVLSLIKDVYETIRDVCEEPILLEPMNAALDGFETENDPKVLEALVKIIVDVAADCTVDTFSKLVDILSAYRQNTTVRATVSRTTIIPPRSTPYPLSSQGLLVNIVVRGMVKLFIRNMASNAYKAVRVYEELVRVAGDAACEADTRLTAMRLLFRLRADSENAVFLIDNPEADYLAGVLNRSGGAEEKEISAIKVAKDEESSSSSRSNRSNSVSQVLVFRHSSSRGATADRSELLHRRNTLWAYPEQRPLPQTSGGSSGVLFTFYDPQLDYPVREGPTLDPAKALRMSLWMEQVIPIIQQGCDWEVYSYVLCHLPSQLVNKTAFRNCKAHVGLLRSYVCDQLHRNRMPSPELPSDVKRADIAVCLIHLLTVLISYREHFARGETEGIVKAFQLGLHSWNRTAKPCIHALSICCYELPGSTSKYLSGILTKLSQIITSPAVSVHILEFLSALAKLPSLYSNFTEPDFRNIFGIAFRYIQHARETATQQSQRSSYHARPGYRESVEIAGVDQLDLPQYVLILAYNVLTTWFLSLRLGERPKYVSWIIRGLVLHDQTNHVDEQSEACIDVLQQFTYSEGDPHPPPKFELPPGAVTKSWLHGSTILTIQATLGLGASRLIVRRPAGTSYYSLHQDTRRPGNELQRKFFRIEDLVNSPGSQDLISPKILPSHILLQLIGGTGSAESLKPWPLADDEKSKRALDVFDRIPVVDFHKIGVVYVGANQVDETEILANSMGSPDYTDFVAGLGKLVRLKGTDINTGGLDREDDIDGEFMYFCKDRTTEIAFHVTTMMPTRNEDPQCTSKKRHIGNDFVNIIFNNSGLPWRFGTIPSQFNFVSIVISPEARSSFVSSRVLGQGSAESKFYRVKLCCKEGFSDISPAQEPKMVSAKNLSLFVRNLALNASVYSHVFNENGREHISNPRHRLRSIKQLRERVGAPPIPSSLTKPTTPLLQQQSKRVSAISTHTTSTDYSLRSINAQVNGETEKDFDTDEVLASLDFSRYT